MFIVMNASTQSVQYKLEYNRAEITPTHAGTPDHKTLDQGDSSERHGFWSPTYDKDITISTVQASKDGKVVDKQDVTKQLKHC